jgi:hypothetical protein
MLGKLVAKAVSKAGRPKRRRGPKPKPKEVKAKKAPVRKKPAKVVRSPRENAELKRLISSQKRDDAPDSNPLPKRRATGPEGSKPVEQGPLLSKVQLPEKMSKAQARRLIMEGKAKVRTDKNGKKKLVSTGEYAPARGVVAEEMGLSKRGKLPSEAELKEMGGFEMRKTGGKAKSKVRKPASTMTAKDVADAAIADVNKNLSKDERAKFLIANALKKKATPKAEERIMALLKTKKPKIVTKAKKNKVKPKKPKDNLKYAAESGSGSTPIGTASKQSTIKSKPDKRKSLSDALFGSFKTGDFTAKNQTVKNPFTGNDMTIEYDFPDSDDMKKGGKVRRRMGGVIKKGFGKATRGY